MITTAQIEQAAREAIDSDSGRDSFMDKIGGPEHLLLVILDAKRYRRLRTMLVGSRSPVPFSSRILESERDLDEIIDGAQP
jgi:hypothetical protein